MEHMPKPEAILKASGMAGFQFEKPRVQELSSAFRNNGSAWESPAAPALPNLAPATLRASLATGQFSCRLPEPVAAAKARPAEVAAGAFASNGMSIDSLRARLHAG